MNQDEWAQSAVRTIENLYGDLLDIPLFSLEGGLEPTQPNGGVGLAALAEEIRFCQLCILHIGRKQSVFGRGSPEARVAFIGDFPSESDNETGEPFSDEAGALLNKMIVAMKLRPEETYLTNAYKCHPPVGQAVENSLFGACEKHLKIQMQSVKAEIIVAMGERAAQAIAHSEAPLRVLRKQELEWNGKKVICTHHPRELLHSPTKKKEAWEDLQSVMKLLEMAR
ncbi:MAG: uracil-DNA glycosylase [Bdellovibrionota bacterium]